ncbi:hypothetical protein AXF42_Ash000448 [Apostasia shenzhenica]|uniref:Uncharacterized protein n=1 Tax=Apostasia shenzhenica TaxID=1088818 RepID=A0A2I0AGD5_9ASPA|nr:hypothetical protein AXF42_Ash000448 [Apostasia shenzhenica]
MGNHLSPYLCNLTFLIAAPNHYFLSTGRRLRKKASSSGGAKNSFTSPAARRVDDGSSIRLFLGVGGGANAVGIFASASFGVLHSSSSSSSLAVTAPASIADLSGLFRIRKMFHQQFQGFSSERKCEDQRIHQE